jgi:predicted RNase H-like nuclease (RuvC/YqgF family)
MGTLSMQYGVAALISVITVARKVMTHEEKIALLETRVSALEKENGEQEMLINSLQEELAKFKAA